MIGDTRWVFWTIKCWGNKVIRVSPSWSSFFHSFDKELSGISVHDFTTSTLRWEDRENISPSDKILQAIYLLFAKRNNVWKVLQHVVYYHLELCVRCFTGSAMIALCVDSNCQNWPIRGYIRFLYTGKSFLIVLPKGRPRLKMPFVLFFSVQSQIAVRVLKRMRPFLLSLRMRMIREHAHG